MPISVKCGCGKGYKLADAAAGKKFQCKACGEVVRVPAAGAGPPTASRKPPGSSAAAPPGARRKPAAAAPAGPTKEAKERPARKPGAPGKTSSKPADVLDYEDDFGTPADDFDDEFGDDFDSPPRRKRSAPPAVGRASRSRKPPEPERPARKSGDKKPTKKKASSGDDEEATPLGMFCGGLFFIALGIGGYFFFANLEEEGGSVRIHALVALIYNLFGKTGVLVIGVLLGLAMIGGAIAKFVNRD